MLSVATLDEEIFSFGFSQHNKMCDSFSNSSPLCSKSNADAVVHFKILVPSCAAGAIIGKGGETIAQLQKDTGARVKMSKANDFYPGTAERVCLVTGSIESILHVLCFIQEKIREKPDPNARPAIDFDSKLMAERDKQVKILVPNSTAGMVIGKAGNYIKQLKEESGAYVQISQKARDHTLAERCITVIGEWESACRRACLLILHKVAEDPQSGSCLNVSYVDIAGPVANFNPTGSPFALAAGLAAASAAASSPASAAAAGAATSSASPVNSCSQHSNGGSDYDGFVLNQSAFTGALHLELLPQPLPPCGGATGGASNGHLSVHVLDHIHSTLRANGYSEQAAHEITAAVDTLTLYGFLGISVPSQASPAAAASSHYQQQQQMTSPGLPVSGNFPPPAGSHQLHSLDHQQQQQQHQQHLFQQQQQQQQQLLGLSVITGDVVNGSSVYNVSSPGVCNGISACVSPPHSSTATATTTGGLLSPHDMSPPVAAAVELVASPAAAAAVVTVSSAAAAAGGAGGAIVASSPVTGFTGLNGGGGDDDHLDLFTTPTGGSSCSGSGSMSPGGGLVNHNQQQQQLLQHHHQHSPHFQHLHSLHHQHLQHNHQFHQKQQQQLALSGGGGGHSPAASPPPPAAAGALVDSAGHSVVGVALPVNKNSYGLGTTMCDSTGPAGGATGSAAAATVAAAANGDSSGSVHDIDCDNTQPLEDHVKMDLEVGEYIVGAILGPGGRSLVEIQHLSGATVQISKKGAFRPGTRNRTVSLSGSPQAVSTAHYLIEQKISEEGVKRARHCLHSATVSAAGAAAPSPPAAAPPAAAAAAPAAAPLAAAAVMTVTEQVMNVSNAATATATDPSASLVNGVIAAGAATDGETLQCPTPSTSHTPTASSSSVFTNIR